MWKAKGSSSIRAPSFELPAHFSKYKTSTFAVNSNAADMSLFQSSQTGSNNQNASAFGGSTNNAQAPSPFGALGAANNQSSPFAKLSPLSTSAANATSSQGSGLFGSNTQTAQPAAGSGLFGSSTQTSQPAGGSSLFANTAQTSQPSGGSGLFGSTGLGGASQQQSAFGQSANTQPQSNSLFSRITPATTQPNPLFGGQSTAQPTPGSSLFPSASTQQPQSSSLFASTQQPQSNSLFSSTQQLGSTQQQGLTATQNGTDIGRPADAPKPAFFEDLLERGRKRRDASSYEVMQAGQLPSLQLSLGDISSKIRGLGASKPDFGASRTADTRAHYLLAASGISQGATRRDLDDFTARSTIASQQAGFTPEPEPVSYWDSLYAKITSDALKASVEQSKRDFDLFIEQNVEMDWEAERRRIYEHFGLVKPSEEGQEEESAGASVGPIERGAFGKSSRRGRSGMGKSTFGKSSAARSILGGSKQRATLRQQSLFPDVVEKSAGSEQNSALGDPYLRDKQDRYIEQVRVLNTNRIEGLCYPIARAFEEVESRGADTPPHLKDAYKALVAIVGEPGQVLRPSDPGAVRERFFAKEYLDETPNSSAALNIRRRILTGSRCYLENEFYQRVENDISSHAREAGIGGIPSKISKVRGFVRIRANRKNLGADANVLQKIGDDYVWVLIFTLLRCGLINEAAEYVRNNETAINAMDRNFAMYIGLYAKYDRNIPLKDRMSMNRVYQQRLLQPANSVDPYRMACYKVMGRCELANKKLEGINQTVDDLIWLYFSLAREANRAEETAGEVFGLEEVQRLMEEIGERQFSSAADAASNYAVYFLMQVLSGMFEKAVGWLYRFNYIAAIHFAIALDYYGLLRVADFNVSDENLVSYTTRDKPQISFGRLVGYYTRDFRLAKADAAADYLVLVCLNKDLPGESGRAHAQMCQEALKELVLETRDFALLLGDLRGDGVRIDGAIQSRLPLFAAQGMDMNEYLRTLTMQAAATADDNGRTTDAVLLYHLSDDFESVLTTINRALGESLSIDIHDEQMQLQPIKPRSAVPGAPDPYGSLSLSSITNPAELAKKMLQVYDNNGTYLQKVQRNTLDTAHILLRMSDVKTLIAQSNWADAIDAISELDFLPSDAQGQIGKIQSCVHRLNNMAHPITRNIGPLLVWTITACGQQRRTLKQRAFEGSQTVLIDMLATRARDMMVFAGLIKYKLSSETFDMLARAGQNVGEGR